MQAMDGYDLFFGPAKQSGSPKSPRITGFQFRRFRFSFSCQFTMLSRRRRGLPLEIQWHPRTLVTIPPFFKLQQHIQEAEMTDQAQA